jgi:hypothetical protein
MNIQVNDPNYISENPGQYKDLKDIYISICKLIELTQNQIHNNNLMLQVIANQQITNNLLTQILS